MHQVKESCKLLQKPNRDKNLNNIIQTINIVKQTKSPINQNRQWKDIECKQQTLAYSQNFWVYF